MKSFLAGLVLLPTVSQVQAQVPGTGITKSTNPHDVEPYIAYSDKGHSPGTAVFALSSKGSTAPKHRLPKWTGNEYFSMQVFVFGCG